MQNRIIIPLLCAAAIAFACGPWNGGGSSTRSDKIGENGLALASTALDGSTHFVAGPTSGEKDSLATSFEVIVNDGVHFAIRVTNNTNKLAELRFPNGKTHDFVVLDSTGNKVLWRWSDGRMFTQALRTRMVQSHKDVSFEDDWDAENMRGTFIAVARLNVEQKPVEKRITFTMPASAATHLTVASK